MKNDLRKAIGADNKGRVHASEKRTVASEGRRRPRKEGHDELIAKLTPVGTEVTLYLNSGEVVKGRLKGSDRFTITVSDIPRDEVESEDALFTNDDSPVIIFYKHSIDAFRLKVIGDNYNKRD